MKKLLLLFPVLVLLLSGCAKKTAYTKSVQERYQLSEQEIKKIQFYTSEDIVMLKSESQSGRETKEGELVVSSSTSEDRLIIKKGTPCVVTAIDGDKFRISFETDAKTLTFESKSASSYYLLVAETVENGKAKVNYGTENYILQQGSGAVYLLFKLKKLKKYKSRDQFVKGRKVD